MPGGAARQVRGYTVTSAWRYKAFISYAHRDAASASWLHRKLESYQPPRAGGGRGQAQQLKPVFRDRDELPASSQLGALLTSALENSEFLIVLCSPAAAASRWVNEEIRHFRKTRGISNILAFIVAGEPNGAEGTDCFPPALTEPDETGSPVEPVAADARPQADGRRLAFLKLAAGLLRSDLDALVQRDAARRNKRLAAIATGSAAGMIAALGLAFYAETQRREAVEQRQLAQTNERTAEATVDYLIDTFEVANPATENPRTITALTILERGAAGIADLRGEPAVQARLYGAVGDIYRNLSIYKSAEQSYRNALTKVEAGSPEAVRLKLLTAESLILQAEFDEARAILTAQDEVLTGLGREGLPLRGLAETLKAKVHKEQLELDQAIAAYLRARSFFERADGDRRGDLTAIADNLATTYEIKGAGDEAEREYLRALSLRREVFPEGHKSVATALNNLAYHYFRAGNIDRAEAFIDEALAIKTRVLEPGNPQLAYTQMMYGQILEAQGDLARAEDQFAAALEGLERAFPDGHYQTGFACVYLASLLGKQGRTEDALALLDRAEHEYDVGYGRLHANHGDLEIYRAGVLVRAGRHEEAGDACRRGVEILDQTIGSEAAAAIELTQRCRDMGVL